MLEHNRSYLNRFPYGEPQLGRRGLYRAMGGDSGGNQLVQALLWVLNMSDGGNHLVDIAERSALSFATMRRAAELLCEHGLLEESPNDDHA